MAVYKAAVGRILPGAVGGQLDNEVHLPTGYHSLYIPADLEQVEPMLAPGTPAFWADNYFVPNVNLVLPTHLVTYSIQAEARLNMMFTPRTLESMPAVVDECKSCGTGMPLDRFCRETGMAACVDCKTSSRYVGKDYTFDSVAELSEVMMSEIADLAAQHKPLKEQMQTFENNLEQFKAESIWRAHDFKEDLVRFVDHYLEVGQYAGERTFDTVRNLSDMDRLQELYYYNQQTMEKNKFVNSWKHVEKQGEDLARRNEIISMWPPLHNYLMALEEKNKRIIGLRREVNHNDEVIKRLTQRLHDNRALSIEDEELIVALSGNPEEG